MKVQIELSENVYIENVENDSEKMKFVIYKNNSRLIEVLLNIDELRIALRKMVAK